jgi:hypothetical protein
MDEDRITIVTVESRPKGELFKTILEKHGIAVHLSPNDKMKILGEASEAKQPFDVIVARKDAEEALDILQSGKTHEVADMNKGFDITVLICPNCKGRYLVKKSFRKSMRQCPRCFHDF